MKEQRLSGDDVLRYEESAMYEEKIRRLEDSISSLRMSRRILMSLMEQMQAQDAAELERLRRENSRLRRQAGNYARRLWQGQVGIEQIEPGEQTGKEL